MVKVSGEVDLETAPHLWDMLNTRLHGGGTKLVVNLADVDFFGATGLRILQRARLLADETGTRLLVSPGESRSARRMLALGEGLRSL